MQRLLRSHAFTLGFEQCSSTSWFWTGPVHSQSLPVTDLFLTGVGSCVAFFTRQRGVKRVYAPPSVTGGS